MLPIFQTDALILKCYADFQNVAVILECYAILSCYAIFKLLRFAEKS